MQCEDLKKSIKCELLFYAIRSGKSRSLFSISIDFSLKIWYNTYILASRLKQIVVMRRKIDIFSLPFLQTAYTARFQSQQAQVNKQINNQLKELVRVYPRVLLTWRATGEELLT